MSGDELHVAVRDELSGTTIGSGYYTTSVHSDEAGEMADWAIRVVLTAVLELVGTKQPRWGVTTAYDQGFLDGWDDHQTAITREIRSLLPKEGSNE